MVMENLADILIFSYVADGTMNRVLQNTELYKKHSDELPGLCLQAYVAEEGPRVMEHARRILNHIFEGNIPKDIQDKLEKLGKRLLLNTDTIEIKKIIGEKTVEAVGYPIKNY